MNLSPGDSFSRGITGTAAVASGMGLAWASGYGKVAYANPALNAVVGLVAREAFKAALTWIVFTFLDEMYVKYVKNATIFDNPNSKTSNDVHERNTPYLIEATIPQQYSKAHDLSLEIEDKKARTNNGSGPIPKNKDLNPQECHTIKEEYTERLLILNPCGSRCDPLGSDYDGFRVASRATAYRKGLPQNLEEFLSLDYTRPFRVRGRGIDEQITAYGVSHYEDKSFKGLLTSVS